MPNSHAGMQSPGSIHETSDAQSPTMKNKYKPLRNGKTGQFDAYFFWKLSRTVHEQAPFSCG